METFTDEHGDTWEAGVAEDGLPDGTMHLMRPLPPEPVAPPAALPVIPA